ncbi:MAG: ATP-binding protein [Acidimicrobiaceae bacterium]|nr:ATP-binding protein [Acidimicrobiaceae bacterium]
MTSADRKIAFKVEFSRILSLLADQIYQSPLALLRENTQNAFDAIRMRQALKQEFTPSIELSVTGADIAVSDNGIGMTSEEIEDNFWYAGRSGKNTAEARAAGVVGTFGIGAMANFGIADELIVESESAVDGTRTRSAVRKADLSTDTAGISVADRPPSGEPGTTVEAHLDPGHNINVAEAKAYLHDFVEFVDIPVRFNGELLSGASHRSALPSERSAWSERREGVSFAGIVTGDLELLGMASGELRCVVENVRSPTTVGRPGSLVLVQGRNSIRTMRSGFGLAGVAMQSRYQWGGVVDLPFLIPTAGREALDATSNQLLQQLIAAIDTTVSPIAAAHEESFANDGFLQWVVATKQFTLCGPLEVTPRPGDTAERLESVVKRSGVRYYGGREASVIATYASQDEPLVVLSRRSPRQDCEIGYLRAAGVEEVDTSPRVLEELPITEQSYAHTALATRVARILEEDYFLGAEVRFGSLSGDLPLLVTETNVPVEIYLDPGSTAVAPLLSLYRDDFSTFSPFVKDFIRSTVFPRVSTLVPSSTRQGAEAFLRHLRHNREWFEYELDDKADLEDIWEELRAGRLTLSEAARRLTDIDRSVVEVSNAAAAPVSSVVKDIADEVGEDDVPDPFSARPSIDRREEVTAARILTSETPVNGYRCFLSLSDRVQREKGDFFLQPHSTEVVWGGLKVVFVFQHHSGQFGLYYDILCPGLVGEASGGGPRMTSTILSRDRTFIPVPDEIAETFLPVAGERKRLEVRCDILYLDDAATGPSRAAAK